jgi:UDP-sugar transporter A1/2/3
MNTGIHPGPPSSPQVTYIGAANLPAAAYQVTNQLRIPMTAALSRALLQKRISRVQIVAVCLLLLGVTLVLLKPDHASADAPVGALRQRNTVVGVTAVLITCLCSTFASVWFEKVLKHGVSTDVPPLSLWSSNILLAGLSLPLAWATAAVQDGPGLVARGLFYGFDPLVIFVLTSHVTGGLLVSLTLKYADNVLKTFATAAALVLSCIGSYLLFGATLSDVFLLGVALVFSSTLLYSLGLPLRCVSGRASVPRRFTKLSSERERDDGCDTDLPIAAEAGTEEGQGARVAPLGDQAHGCRKPHASS